jgi:Putative beta-barrel porin-2, OmpL-like. bbp2
MRAAGVRPGRLGSKSQRFGFFDARQFFHFLDQVFRNRTVHFDERDRRSAPVITAEREGRDIEPGARGGARRFELLYALLPCLCRRVGHGGGAGGPERAAGPPTRRPPPWPVSPESSPPMPFADWPQGGNDYIGESTPNAVDSPLMNAIGTGNVIGQTLHDEHTQIYGWFNPGGNVSSAKTGYNGNAPAAYAFTPNIAQLDQAVVYVERIPDTVQMDHIDWGFRISGLYGENYRYTTSYGVFSNQLLYGNHYAGYDMPTVYAEMYIPYVAQGLEFCLGRYISVPDIEAQLAPNNYMYSHSMTYAWDNYTNEGLQSSLKLTQNWELQLGVSMSTETTVWNQTHISLINPTTGFPGYQGPRDPGAQPSVTGCVQYESNTAWDNIYLCADGINNGKWGYNNLQWFGGTYYHKFNDQWHISMESRYMVGKDLPDVSQGLGNTAFAYILPTNHPNEAICSSGQTQCTAKAVTFLFYLNYQFSPPDNISLRGEYFDDINGRRTGFATAYNNWALGWQHWLSPQVELRPEIAWYHALDAPAFDNGTKHAIAVVSGDVIWHF